MPVTAGSARRRGERLGPLAASRPAWRPSSEERFVAHEIQAERRFRSPEPARCPRARAIDDSPAVAGRRYGRPGRGDAGRLRRRGVGDGQPAARSADGKPRNRAGASGCGDGDGGRPAGRGRLARARRSAGGARGVHGADVERVGLWDRADAVVGGTGGIGGQRAPVSLRRAHDHRSLQEGLQPLSAAGFIGGRGRPADVPCPRSAGSAGGGAAVAAGRAPAIRR